MRCLLRGASLGLLLLVATPALAQKAAPRPATTPKPAEDAEPKGMVLERVVAVVNEEALTLTEIQEDGQPVIRKIFQDFIGPERERRVEEAQKRVMDDLIDRRLMMQVAKREGMLPSATEVTGAIDDLKRNNNATTDAQFRAMLKAEGLTLEQLRRIIEERLAIGRLLTRQIRSTIILGEDELQKYYATHQDKYQRTPEAQIRLIFIAAPPGGDEAAARSRVEEVQAKLSAGADFAKMAEEYSDSPTKEKGGEVGIVHKGDLAPEIEAAAFSVREGGVSPPIRTEAGWSLIQVESRRTETVAPFAEVRDAIRDQLLQEKFDAKRKDWVASLRARAFIQVLMEPEALKAELQKPK